MCEIWKKNQLLLKSVKSVKFTTKIRKIYRKNQLSLKSLNFLFVYFSPCQITFKKLKTIYYLKILFRINNTNKLISNTF